MPGVTDIRTPLTEVLRKRQGVCQDFAHLMIALIRCAGLPARYVSGYLETESVRGASGLVGATASHAWVEVWIPPVGWLALDPTHDQQIDNTYIKIGAGRDYGDVSPVSGSYRGTHEHKMTIEVQIDAMPA